jgi:hypothetical protein
MSRSCLLVVCFFAFFLSISATVASDKNEWRLYENSVVGLSFRYPPSLRVRERKQEEFLGVNPPPAAVIELLGSTQNDPDVIVLRFFVADEHTSPETGAYDVPRRSLRDLWSRLRGGQDRDRPSRKSEYFIVDGQKAVIRFTCGRSGAGHWSIHILHPKPCSVVSFAPAKPFHDLCHTAGPHDYTFPVLSIIRTVRLSIRPQSR